MNVLIDTNVLVHAVNAESPHHAATRSFVEGRRHGEGFCVTWSILYEWLRVVSHPRVFTRPLEPGPAADFIHALVDDARVVVLRETPNHVRFLTELLEDAPPLRGNIYHDLHIATLMREHGVSVIVTADRHFRVFPFLSIIDPTRD